MLIDLSSLFRLCFHYSWFVDSRVTPDCIQKSLRLLTLKFNSMSAKKHFNKQNDSSPVKKVWFVRFINDTKDL